MKAEELDRLHEAATRGTLSLNPQAMARWATVSHQAYASGDLVHRDKVNSIVDGARLEAIAERDAEWQVYKEKVEALVEEHNILAKMAADYATQSGDPATPDEWKAEAYRLRRTTLADLGGDTR